LFKNNIIIILTFIDALVNFVKHSFQILNLQS